MPLDPVNIMLNRATAMYMRKALFIPVINIQAIIIKEVKVNNAILLVGKMEAKYIKIMLKAAKIPPKVILETLFILNAPLAA